jgi:radical SAM superfamily enzyme YgiQ (UPF0313 family)
MKNSVKIILLNPLFEYSRKSIYNVISKHDPPLGLIQLSAYLNQNNVSALVIDLNVEISNYSELPNFFKNLISQYDITEETYFGIPFLTTFSKNSYELAFFIKKMFPKNKIVAGGAHATFMPNEVLENENIDFVVRGEGEITTLELLQGKNINFIDGISYKEINDNEIKLKHNQCRKRIKDINILPIPDYKQLKIERYRPVLGSYKSLPAINIITSRGCPGKCTFCCRTFGNYTSFLNAEKIFDIIKYLINNFNVKQVNFYDDTFTLNKKRVIELCRLIISNNIKIDWTCFSRVDKVDNDLLKLMKKAGCYQIMYGIENFNSDVLFDINKKINIEKAFEVIKLTKSNKINTRVSLLIGNPKDTTDILDYNLQQLRKMKPDIVVFNITTPFPGTELFNWAKSENRLLTEDWSMYDGKQAVMKIDGMSEKQIYNYYHKMYFKFYFRLAFILVSIKNIQNFTILISYIKVFFLLLKFFIKRIFSR